MKRHGVRNLLMLQILLVAIVAIVVVFVRPQPLMPGIAAFYGGAMAIINTLLLARRTRRASAMGGSPEGQTMGLMAGMVERMVFTLVAFGIGMGWLRLDPISLLAAFGCAQLAYAAGGASLRQAAMPGMNQVKR